MFYTLKKYHYPIDDIKKVTIQTIDDEIDEVTFIFKLLLITILRVVFLLSLLSFMLGIMLKHLSTNQN